MLKPSVGASFAKGAHASLMTDSSSDLDELDGDEAVELEVASPVDASEASAA